MNCSIFPCRRQAVDGALAAGRCQAGALAGMLWLGLSWAAVVAQDPQSPPPPSQPRRVVAATVDGTPVHVDQVERELRRALGDRQVDWATRQQLQARMLQQLVNRLLGLRYLTRTGQGASEQDVDLAVAQVQKELQVQEQTLDDYRKQLEMDDAEYRAQLAWQIAWARFLQRYLTDENLQKYFARNRRDFDGTQVRVAHILWKASPEDDTARDEALREASQLRADILASKIPFAAAARRFSEAPSADDGGELGWISRTEPMPEPFSTAAFALEPGDISQAVITPFGVHLILCQQIKPGQLRWHQARDQLTPAVTRYLFQWIADQERQRAEVRYTGASPHFRPGTEELAK